MTNERQSYRTFSNEKLPLQQYDLYIDVELWLPEACFEGIQLAVTGLFFKFTVDQHSQRVNFVALTS